MSNTKNVGQVAGLYIGTSAPTNTTLIWYDSTSNQRCHKIYDYSKSTWVALNPQVVSTTTYSELVNNAKKNGLSIGKYYQIKDKSNALAIAISSTKVEYCDTLGNILVDDLGTNIQYHVSSGNLLIDDVAGVFNTSTNKLVFSFTENGSPQQTDYILGKHKSGTVWQLVKYQLSKLISTDKGNSITWSGGLFFSFTNALTAMMDKSGGVVGYTTYQATLSKLNTAINNVGKDNQTIINNANDSIANSTSAEAVYNKALPNSIDLTVAAADVIKGDTLFNIVSKFQRWVTKMKYATGIRISNTFADAAKKQYINTNDSVESALGKIQYQLKNPTTVNELPSGWTYVAPGITTSNGVTTGWNGGDLPVAGDTFSVVFSKLTNYLHYLYNYFTLPDDFQYSYTTGTTYSAQGFPKIGDSYLTVIEKLTSFCAGAYDYIVFPASWGEQGEKYVSGELPAANDKLSTAVLKLRDWLKIYTSNLKLLDGWRTTSTHSDDYSADGFPQAGDTYSKALAKLTAFCSGAYDYIELPGGWDGGISEDDLPTGGDSISNALLKLTNLVNTWIKNFTTKLVLSSSYDTTSTHGSKYSGALPSAGDTYEVAIGKLDEYISNIMGNAKLPSTSGFSYDNLPAIGDNLTTAFQKLNAYMVDLFTKLVLPEDWDEAATKAGDLPVAGDTLAGVIVKLSYYCDKIIDKAKLLSGWTTATSYSRLAVGDSLSTALAKLDYAVSHITNDQIVDETIDYTKVVNKAFFATDIFRIELKPQNFTFDGGIGACIVEGYQNEFFAADANYPYNPYRVTSFYSSSFPRVVAFTPVIPVMANDQNCYANAASFIHITDSDITLQFLIQLTKAKYTELKNAGYVYFKFEATADVYGTTKSTSAWYVSIGMTNTANVNIMKSVLQSGTYQHIMFDLKVTATKTQS